MTTPCDNIGIKCHVRDVLLQPLYDFRRDNPGKLGTLGPADFQLPSEFLESVANTHKQPKCCYNQCDSYAFGDLHGDLLVALSVLHLTGLISDTGHWIGLKSAVFFCGDILDRAGRGDDNTDTEGNIREEVDLVQYLHHLHQAAAIVGGAVVVVVGNHEIGRVFWKEMEGYQKFVGSQACGWGDNMGALFSPGGDMAKYMAGHYPLIARCQNFLFMHGGPSPGVIEKLAIEARRGSPVSSVHKILNNYLYQMFHQAESVVQKDVQSVAWERLFSKHTSESFEENTCTKIIGGILEAFGIYTHGGLVLGHSIQDRILPYCDGKVWRLDLGMSEAFGRKVEGADPLGGIHIIQRLGDTFSIVTSHQTFPGSDEVVLTSYVNGKRTSQRGVSLEDTLKTHSSIL